MMSNLTRTYLRQRLAVADNEDSGRAFREVLRVLRWAFNFDERACRIWINAQRPAIDAERYNELALLADLAATSVEGGA